MTAINCIEVLRHNAQAKRSALKIALVLFLGLFFQWHLNAQNVSLTVVGPDGEAVPGYRWLLEEDGTFHVTPGFDDPEPLGINFHKSYMIPVNQGHAAGPEVLFVDSTKHYFLSILPDEGYTISGASIEPGQDSVTVTCNKFPLPTAQITVFVYQDNQPINNAPDLPEEQGLAGFKIVLYDAAGKYGMAGGQVMMDVYSNPIGTTYDASGSVVEMGRGVVFTDANGEATIQNLWPAKYGVQAVPPRLMFIEALGISVCRT